MCISEVLTRTMCCMYQRGVDKDNVFMYQRGVDKDNVLYVSARC